jgi:hypothetical protein
MRIVIVASMSTARMRRAVAAFLCVPRAMLAARAAVEEGVDSLDHDGDVQHRREGQHRGEQLPIVS